jgi:LysM repeat protein
LKIHFVKAGDTLYEISKKYGVSVEEIMAANTSVADPNKLVVGTKLVIPERKVQGMSPNIPAYPDKALPQAPASTVNQGYPFSGQAVPPFATMPLPAQPAYDSAPITSAPTWGFPTNYTSYAPQSADWTMPAQVIPGSGYDLPYNTPYHMTNYSVPSSFNHPALQGIPQAPQYIPFPSGPLHNPGHGNYEYYNTYPSSYTQTEPDLPQSQRDHENNEGDDILSSNVIDSNLEQRNKTKARTSSTSQGSGNRRQKKNSLRDQVMRMQQANKKKRSR